MKFDKVLLQQRPMMAPLANRTRRTETPLSPGRCSRPAAWACYRRRRLLRNLPTRVSSEGSSTVTFRCCRLVKPYSRRLRHQHRVNVATVTNRRDRSRICNQDVAALHGVVISKRAAGSAARERTIIGMTLRWPADCSSGESVQFYRRSVHRIDFRPSTSRAPKIEFRKAVQADLARPDLVAKIIRFALHPNQSHPLRIPPR